MRNTLLVLAALLASTPVFSQENFIGTTRVDAGADSSRNAVLKGISQLYLEVAFVEGARAEDGDLRGELRDAVELELRRAGIMLRENSPGDLATRSPVLRMEVKFERGSGRFMARMNLALNDQVTVVRNRETLLARVWDVERSVSAPMDPALIREVRLKAKEMTVDFLSALKRANGGR